MDLKIKDVAELLNVSETTIRRWLVEGKIPAYRLNHQYRFSRTEIESWVMSQKLGKTLALNAGEKEVPSAKKGGSQQFSLFRAINNGSVLFNLPGSHKDDVIRSATNKLAETLDLDGGVLADLLLDREGLQSTGVGNGIAIPHTRDYLLTTHTDVVAIAFPEKHLNYGAIDGKPVHTLFFLLASDDKRHLHLLAKIAHLCSIPDTLNLLKSRPTKEAILDYVKGWESGIQKIAEEEAIAI